MQEVALSAGELRAAFVPAAGMVCQSLRHGGDAVEFYTRKKTVTSRWFSSGQGSGAYFVER